MDAFGNDVGGPWGDAGPPGAVDVPGLPAVARVGAGSRSGWAYTPELGDAIAEQYAECDARGGLWELRALAPDRIPPPAIIRAWCRQFPAFGLVMREAERVRAEKLMEQAVMVADSAPLSVPPARVALMVSARHRMAESLDAGRWGKGATGGHHAAPQLASDQPTALDVDDATLASIALGGAGGAADGSGGGG
jgi:hypothetical protein